MSNLLEAALAYARRGWPVFPLHSALPQGDCTCGRFCSAAGKHPRTPRGFHDATTDVRQIHAWWWCWPEANLGVVTGRSSGLIALDVDVHHGGEDSLAHLEAAYDHLPPTLIALTGGGGRHFLFVHPGGNEYIPNTTRLGGWPGLDLRGDGGYIVAPPSLHPSGQRYAWATALPLAPIPIWLADLRELPSHQIRIRPILPASHQPYQPLEMGAFWLQRALEQVSPGNRNATGFWLCCQLRDAGLTTPQAEQWLRVYAACVPAGDHPYLLSEALASLHSAYSHPPREPAERRK